MHSDPPRPAPSPAGFRTLACGLGARFPGPFSGVFSRFPLSFSAPCGRAKRQVRKADSIKIKDLEPLTQLDMERGKPYRAGHVEKKNQQGIV
ncbi:hypothetical protein ACQCRI_23295, partial [Ralstonia pseudosolanacearum]